MRKCVILFLLFSSSLAHAGKITLDEVRIMFFESIQNSDRVDSLAEKLNDASGEATVINAYRGAVRALQANKCSNPVLKFAYANRALTLLDESVKQSPDNLEIRFLRFSIQYHMPAVIGFQKDMAEDKDWIIRFLDEGGIPKLQPRILSFIYQFMEDSGRCTDDELDLIREALTMKE